MFMAESWRAHRENEIKNKNQINQKQSGQNGIHWETLKLERNQKIKWDQKSEIKESNEITKIGNHGNKKQANQNNQKSN